MSEAAGLAAALEDGLGVKATLVKGDGGIFDVAVNDTIVFSKKEHGGFIPASEIVVLVKAELEAAG